MEKEKIDFAIKKGYNVFVLWAEDGIAENIKKVKEIFNESNSDKRCYDRAP